MKRILACLVLLITEAAAESFSNRTLSSLCEAIECSGDWQSDNPVCGSNGVRYESLCAFELVKCENPSLGDVHVAPCARNSHCELSCEDLWSPICGSDDVTYRNPCHLEEAFCRNHQVEPTYYGVCQANTK
uniref:Kazal-like domain-containing protein n=1 Tax=Globisporangium ultimum (strain ATCC 200006 / CBS 805.95 / DAOM BR144) TaxID=431595 RepID=K3X4L1_GLOUD